MQGIGKFLYIHKNISHFSAQQAYWLGIIKNALNIHCHLSKHTLPFIFRYFAIYVDILFCVSTTKKACLQRKSKLHDMHKNQLKLNYRTHLDRTRIK